MFRMTRRTKWIVVTLLVVFSLLATASWSGRRRQYRTVASSAGVLNEAGLTTGASAARVLLVLDSLGAAHSSMAAGHTVGANLGRSFEEFMIHGDILVTFQFDSSDHLVARHIREVLTGP